MKHWIRWGQAKIAVKVNNEAELLAIRDAAEQEGLINFLARDSDVSKNNARVLAIGPDVAEDINVVTGHLKLL